MKTLLRASGLNPEAPGRVVSVQVDLYATTPNEASCHERLRSLGLEEIESHGRFLRGRILSDRLGDLRRDSDVRTVEVAERLYPHGETKAE